MLKFIVLGLALLVSTSVLAAALTPAQERLMDTYGSVLGRALGCQLPLADKLSQEVAAWVGRKLQPDSDETVRQMQVLMAITAWNKKQQLDGLSPTTCEELSRYLEEDEFWESFQY